VPVQPAQNALKVTRGTVPDTVGVKVCPPHVGEFKLTPWVLIVALLWFTTEAFVS
jgi:hypothetical protein